MREQCIMHNIELCIAVDLSAVHIRHMAHVSARRSTGRVVVVHSEPIASALKAFSYASCKAAQKSEHFAFIINNMCFLICMS